MLRWTQLNLNQLLSSQLFLRAFLVAGIGPDPINDGSTPQVAHDTILSHGF